MKKAPITAALALAASTAMASGENLEAPVEITEHPSEACMPTTTINPETLEVTQSDIECEEVQSAPVSEVSTDAAKVEEYLRQTCGKLDTEEVQSECFEAIAITTHMFAQDYNLQLTQLVESDPRLTPFYEGLEQDGVFFPGAKHVLNAHCAKSDALSESIHSDDITIVRQGAYGYAKNCLAASSQIFSLLDDVYANKINFDLDIVDVTIDFALAAYGLSGGKIPENNKVLQRNYNQAVNRLSPN